MSLSFDLHLKPECFRASCRTQLEGDFPYSALTITDETGIHNFGTMFFPASQGERVAKIAELLNEIAASEATIPAASNPLAA